MIMKENKFYNQQEIVFYSPVCFPSELWTSASVWITPVLTETLLWEI